ncbi:hypothetical protein LDENG_00009530 [Lucifuga dentata]|nr:hypothetical protein LDENG_00009530 [Lucifuga dentata]
MYKLQILRELVNQRLNAAVEEILGLCERTFAEYQEEFQRSQEESQQVKLLNAAFIPGVRLHRADIQQLLVQQERRLLVQQERRSSLDQEEPEPSHVKEEQEELGTRQKGKQLQDLEEADITRFPFTLVPVRSEDDEDKVQSSQLHQSQTEENRKAKPLASSSTEQTETGAHVEDCGGPGPSRNLDPGTSTQPAGDEKISDSSESGDGEDDWKDTREPHSSLNNPKNYDVHDSDVGRKTNKKSFSCSECGATFKNMGILRKHMRTHTENKPFSCSVCGKSFTCSAKLNYHMMCHSGAKPFSCSILNKLYRRERRLLRHMKSHTAF